MEEPRNEMETFSSIQYKAAKYYDKLVLVRDCMTGQKGITCLDCGKDLVVKKGNIKQHHFAHAKGSSCSAYSGYNGKGGETVEHYKAKAKIAERFNNAEKLQIMRRLCIGCSKNEMITDLALYKQNGYLACVEFSYTDKVGVRRKADVAVVDNSANCHFIVEIKQTHATPESNREGCSWVELCASSVNNNTDDTFICIRCPNRYCVDCENEIKRRQELWKQERLRREQEERRLEFIGKQDALRKEEAKRTADELERTELENRKRRQKEDEERIERHQIKMKEIYRQKDEERTRKKKEEDERIQKQKEEEHLVRLQELKVWHENRKYKMDFMNVLKQIKTLVVWIEPIKPIAKKLIICSVSIPNARLCLTCRRWNNDSINKCKCDRPKYKPLDGVLRFV
jgi:hypothetical protein